MAAPHRAAASDALTIVTPRPPTRSDAAHSGLDSSFAPAHDDQRWWQSDHDGVALFDAPIIPNIPNLGNDAFNELKASLCRNVDSVHTDTGVVVVICAFLVGWLAI